MVFLFAITLFISAAMLFIAELMFAKMILPSLGGTPAVWNTCMVFFQAALLAGYGYAHMVTSRFKVKKQVIMHLVLILLPLLVLPIAIPETWRPPVNSDPIGSILLLMIMSIGLPFVVVSTSAPLIQRWFAYTGHESGSDPYFLYAASNAGSFFGLIGYIILIEPRLTVGQQTHLWRYGYIALMILTAACALIAYSQRSRAAEASSSESAKPVSAEVDDSRSDAPVTFVRQIKWLLLAFAPSSLLLGFTTYVTTDITSVPLLWVVPLSLYLFTFILAFSRRNFIPQKLLVFSLPVLVLFQTVVLPYMGTISPVIPVAVNLLTFFIAAMACHTELANDRPGTEHLTKFYLLVSTGGALGGLFNGLVAPVVFSSVVEYPLVMIIACVLCLYHKDKAASSKNPAATGREMPWLTDLAFIAGVGAITAWVIYCIKHFALDYRGMVYYVPMLCLIVVACLTLMRRPLRFGIGVALVLVIMSNGLNIDGQVVKQKRSFFGVLRVRTQTNMIAGESVQVNLLVHGTTIHGVQIRNPEYRDVPISYFYRTGPIGQLLTSYNALGRLHDIGVTGLGAGALAAYAQPGQNLTFYEIDPLVKEVAEDSAYFTYLSDAKERGVNTKIVLGDARLTIAKVPNKAYDLIIFDAFSSDSIPVHLLTKQAVASFLTKLRDHGVIAIQITNKFLDLEPIIGNVAADLHLSAMVQRDNYYDNSMWWKFPSAWIIVARDSSDFGPLKYDKRWKRVTRHPEKSIWTDDYSNIIEAIKRK